MHAENCTLVARPDGGKWDQKRSLALAPGSSCFGQSFQLSNEQFSERFERQARAVAALYDPNICALHDAEPNYLVMEYTGGTPLKGPLPIVKALNYAAQVYDTLRNSP